MIGTRLGPYEILEKIGAGGMGEVYRARDTRLGREVAVKVLPAHLATDPDRLRRFEQEARAAGVLNHPNILSVHDVGTHGGAPYLVTELLEGETLRERLGGSPLPVRKTIELSAQLAHGLAAAHGKGIVHRDLKPENVFVTRDGRIKILDFGLAKLTQAEDSGEALTDLPTSPLVTDPGRVMGTAGYMSPEQVRGRPSDARSDVFAFGAILYEMLTGRRAFRRDSAVETMNAILKEDPPEITQVNPALPPALERIVRHCLEKNPEERFQSARDLAFDLQSLSGASESSLRTVMEPAPAWRWVRPAVVAGIAAILILAGYLAGMMMSRMSPPDFQTLTFRRGFVYGARFAPDGETIIYGAAWEGRPFEIFVTRSGSPESRPLGIANADLLSISRSGELAVLINRRIRIGWESSGTLARVSLSGGAPRELAENIQHADWSPDGKSLAVVRYVDRGCRLEYPLGRVLYETGGWVSHVRVSPDGQSLAFLDHPLPGDDRGTVMVMDTQGKNRKALTSVWASIQGLAWSANGKEIWFSAGLRGPRTLRAVSLGGLERVLAHLPGHTMIQDVFRDGRGLATVDYMHRGISVFAPGADQERDLSWLDWSMPAAISTDGTSVLFSEQGVGAGEAFYAMYLRRTDGAPAVSLGEGQPVAISPDGRSILAGVTRPTPHLALLPAGPGEPIPLPGTEIADSGAGGFSPDGRRIVFVGREMGKGARFYLTEVSGRRPRALTPEEINPNFLALGPEAAAVSGAEGRIQIFPYDGGAPRSVLGGEGASDGERPIQWSADGKAIYFLRVGDPILRFHRLDLATGERTLAREIQPTGREGVLDYGPAYITPDGRAYVYSYRRVLSTLSLIQGLR